MKYLQCSTDFSWRNVGKIETIHRQKRIDMENLSLCFTSAVYCEREGELHNALMQIFRYVHVCLRDNSIYAQVLMKLSVLVVGVVQIAPSSEHC